MSEFYKVVMEEIILADGSKGREMPTRVRISQHEAVELSKSTFQALTELEASYDDVQKKYNELDRVCVDIGKKIFPLREARSPKLRQVEDELRLARRERDGVKGGYNQERSRLLNVIEGLSLSVIAPVLEKWRVLRVEINSKLKYEVIGNAGWKGHQKYSSVLSNRKSISNALMAILMGEVEVKKMYHSPLQEILKFVEDQEKIFSSFNFDDFDSEPETISEETLLQVQKGPESSKVAGLSETHKMMMEVEFDRRIKDTKEFIHQK
jgi:hypothetical protein